MLRCTTCRADLDRRATWRSAAESRSGSACADIRATGDALRRVAGRRYTSAAVFDTLSDRLQAALGDLGSAGRSTKRRSPRAMREIRLALLEADVNFEVVKEFVGARPRARDSAQDVLKGLTPASRSSRSCTRS